MIEFVQQGLVDHDGRVEPMDGARAVVEQVGNDIELLLAVHRQVWADSSLKCNTLGFNG